MLADLATPDADLVPAARGRPVRHGTVGLLIRRNPLVMFMCIELMLNAVNLSFVALSVGLDDINGQTAVFFVLVVAAAEVVVGLRDHRWTSCDADPGAPRPTTSSLMRWLTCSRSFWPCLPAWRCSAVAVLLGSVRRIGEPLAAGCATAICGTDFVLAVGRSRPRVLSRPDEERSVLSVSTRGSRRWASTSTVAFAEPTSCRSAMAPLRHRIAR
jgi:hypothetical protein